MRTIETDRAVVEIIAWPEDRPWTGRYRTSSQIEGNLCTLTLSPDVFHDAAKANTAYRRFARKISREGMEPPNVVFRNMLSRASQNIFCMLVPLNFVLRIGLGNSNDSVSIKNLVIFFLIQHLYSNYLYHHHK